MKEPGMSRSYWIRFWILIALGLCSGAWGVYKILDPDEFVQGIVFIFLAAAIFWVEPKP